VDSTTAPWLYTPSLDLIVGCGGWSVPLLLIGFWLSSSSNYAASVVFYALALVTNYPHYSATLYRAYRTRADFRKYRVFTLHLTVLLAVAGVLTHWAYSLLPWVFTIYITWSPWHYTGQNFGLAMMFARRGGAEPTKRERNALWVSYLAAYLMLFLAFHTGASGDRLVVSIGLPDLPSKIARWILLLLFLGSAFYGLRRLVRRSGFRAMAAPLTLLASQCLWFVLPAGLELVSGLHFPQTRYSTGILAVMHAAQYLWITSYYARREAEARGESRWNPWSYFATLAVVGAALFVPGPWLISYVFHYDFGASFLVFTAIVNIHHFLLDGAVWKLRDGKIASLLIGDAAGSGRQAASSGQQAAGSGQQAAGSGHFAGRGIVTRTLTVAAVVALLLLTGVDQYRFFLGSGGDAQQLARAESLNPYDAAVKLRIARAHAQSGNVDEAAMWFGRAIAANPYNPEPQQALAKVLLENQRYDEAYEHYKRMVALLPRDTDALVNLGTLSVQMGRNRDAIDYWTRALSVSPDQDHVHVYLAEAYERENDLVEAIPHYERYLASLANSEDQKLDPRQVLFITLKLAQFYGYTNNPDRALVFCERALELAHRAGEKKIESLALGSLANLKEKRGDRAYAARCHQRALALDAESKDSQAEGMDWFNYAQFLRRFGSPGHLVLACCLKAELLLIGASGVDLSALRKTREEVELAVKEPEKSRVRDHLDTVAREALALKF
jgi:tetratricopeptide (TPR) repeat protein